MTCETSIVIPLYNAERFIEDTIESVLKQQYTDWELIIIDDGSSDKSAELVKKYLKDERITYFHQKNGGVSAARNAGIKKSKGAYIALLDADDIFLPENLIEKIAALKDNSVDWVFSDMNLIDENSFFKGKTEVGTDHNIFEHYLLWDRTVVSGPCSNIVIKKSCIEKSDLRFDPAFSTAADQDFCFNLSSKYAGKHVPKGLVNYRVHSQSMRTNIKVMEKDHLGVYRKAKKNHLFRSFLFEKKCFSNLYLILAGSWWKDANNKLRGSYFLLRAFICYPPNLIKILKKI